MPKISRTASRRTRAALAVAAGVALPLLATANAFAATGQIQIQNLSGQPSGLCVRDNTNSAPAAGDAIHLNNCGTTNTTWTWSSSSQTIQIINDATGQPSGLCLRDNTNSAPAAGDVLTLQSTCGSVNTQFTQRADGGIEIGNSGLCIRDNTNSAPAVGDPLVLNTCGTVNTYFSNDVFAQPAQTPVLNPTVAAGTGLAAFAAWPLLRLVRRRRPATTA